jgi:hypothetical protein
MKQWSDEWLCEIALKNGLKLKVIPFISEKD